MFGTAIFSSGNYWLTQFYNCDKLWPSDGIIAIRSPLFSVFRIGLVIAKNVTSKCL